jgi:hypothetical protein
LSAALGQLAELFQLDGYFAKPNLPAIFGMGNDHGSGGTEFSVVGKVSPEFQRFGIGVRAVDYICAWNKKNQTQDS